jgi:hypothetical protein
MRASFAWKLRIKVHYVTGKPPQASEPLLQAMDVDDENQDLEEPKQHLEAWSGRLQAGLQAGFYRLVGGWPAGTLSALGKKGSCHVIALL